MDSPEHRANILANGLSHYGFGLAPNEEGVLYAVETFAGPGISRGSADSNPIEPAKQSELAASIVNDLRDPEEGLLSASSQLIELAKNALPDTKLTEVSLDALELKAAVQGDPRWRIYRFLIASWGGCGDEATAGDVRFFVKEWLDTPEYRHSLLNPELTKVGLLIESDGAGRKVAVAILAG